ncbi:hypothetical protein TELCIR_10254 [Teladorsagia circumcincta]|uniref:Uncharacterized protein n=1 Tax=Teladorsagia circumcincta TaxID=45464 RepID=A0A2G9UCK3_TELCI|nr:hypothetical protein TELCIR_10254 [Teladorsagia circumcincta]
MDEREHEPYKVYKGGLGKPALQWAESFALHIKTRQSVVVLMELDLLTDRSFRTQSLVGRRAPYHVDKLSFGLSSKNVSHIHYCKFWTSLLQPRTVSVYSLAGGVSMQLGDYYWLFTLQVDRVSVVNCLNLGSYVLSEVIREWYCGKQKFLPNIDITFLKNGRTRIPFHIEDLLKRVKYKMVDNCAVIERRIDGDMKQIYRVRPIAI